MSMPCREGCLCGAARRIDRAQRRHAEAAKRCLRERRRAAPPAEEDEQQDILAVAAAVADSTVALLCAETPRHREADPSHPCVCRRRGLAPLPR